VISDEVALNQNRADANQVDGVIVVAIAGKSAILDGQAVGVSDVHGIRDRIHLSVHGQLTVLHQHRTKVVLEHRPAGDIDSEVEPTAVEPDERKGCPAPEIGEASRRNTATMPLSVVSGEVSMLMS
jgi:hypothetical protein